MPSQSTSSNDEMRKEDFISKFQINEIVPLLRISERYNVDITEGKKYLIKALHTARTTRDMDEIVRYLEESKKQIENALANHFTRWYTFLRMDMEKKMGNISPKSSLPHMMETAEIFIQDKNYDTVASLLSRCELELLKLAVVEPTSKPKQDEATEKLQTEMNASSISEIPTVSSKQDSQVAPQSKPVPTAQRTKVTDVVKCGICMGKIKSGAMAIECDCGMIFHEPCAKRSVTCPNCGTVFGL